MASHFTHTSWFILCVALCVLGLFFPFIAYAGLDVGSAFVPGTGGGDDAWQVCENTRGITNRVVTCVLTAVRDTAEVYFEEIYSIFAQIITIAVTISVLFMGYMMVSQGLQQPARDIFVQFFKIAVVTGLVVNLPELFDMVVGLMYGMTDLVVQFGGDAFPMPHCPSPSTPWDRVDCMIEVLIGVDLNTSSLSALTTSQNLNSGIFAFLVQILFSGILGFIIALVGFFVVLGTLFAIIKAIMTYIMSFIGLTFMTVIGPIFVPMYMFRSLSSGGTNYAGHYTTIIISFILQPVLIMGYLTIMMVAMDRTFFSGQYSFMAVLAGASNASATGGPYAVNGQFSITKYIGEKHKETVANTGICPPAADGTPRTLLEPAKRCIKLDLSDSTERETENKETGTFGVQALIDASGTGDILNIKDNCLTLSEAINMECLAVIRQGEGAPDINLGSASDESAGISRATLIAMASVALTLLIFMAMMDYVPQLAGELAGGLFQAPQLYNNVSQSIAGTGAGALADRVALGANQALSGAIDRVSGSLVGGR